METKKLSTEIRQDQLAQAALSLIAAHGLKGLSVARVARRIGLVPSAVYRHFSSKDKLLSSVLDLIGGRLQSNVAVASSGGDTLEALRVLLMGHVRMIRENRGILQVVFSEDVHYGHPERKARVHALVKGYLAKLAEMVARGQANGEIRPDVDPATVSLMLLGLVQPAAILWHLSDGGFDVTKQVERAWQLFSERLRPA
jgi:AcrR family transcriptional regulator